MEVDVILCDLHPAQQQILSEAKRFNVLKCGRRFGKTELTKELSIQKMLDGKSVGLFMPTYKDVSDTWAEIKNTVHNVIAKQNEQLKHLKLITGGTLDIWSMEDPNSGRGRKYHRVIIDEGEKARHLKDAWEQTIRATLTDYQGDAWFMSTPKFGTTYFKEHLFKNEQRFNDWKSWRFTSYDNPHLSKYEIDSIKNQLVDVVFRCEFLAEDVNLSYNRWAFAFDPIRHIAQHLDPITWSGNHNEPLYLSFDFNRNPITCSVVQHYNGTVYFLEQIKLENSDIYKLCDYILTHWGNFLYIVTGDASGKSSSALVQDNRNFYTVIMEKLRISPMQLKIPSVNPKLEENQVLVNSILQHYNIQIHPHKCKALIYDLENVSMNPDGSIVKENRQDPTQQADCLDCARYYFNTFHKGFLRIKENSNFVSTTEQND